jgi:hypothetical protein
MKKLLLLPALLLLFTSCDFMLKEREDDEAEVSADKKVVLGHDKDDKGCVTSAGYKWSVLRKECIRVFEEGYRLNSADSLKAEDIAASAFIVFDKNEEQAELYLPNNEKSVVLNKEASGMYKSGSWALNTKSNYQLSNGNAVVYAAAVIQENKVIGDDWKGEVAAPVDNDTVNR